MSEAANPTLEMGANLDAEDAIASLLQQEATQDVEAKPEGETDEDAKAEATEETESEVSETEEVTTEDAKEYESEIEFLADKFGLDADKFQIDENGKVLFNAKVDGEDTQVNFGDLVKSYQLEKHINNKSQAISDDQKQWEAQKQAQEQAILTELQQAQEITNFYEQQLSAEFNAVPWNDLRENDSAEWTARRQEFAERAQQLQTLKQTAQNQLLQRQQEAQQLQAQQMQEMLTQQGQMLVEKIPEWSDQSIKSADLGKLNNFLSNQYGFSEQDLATVYDHRLVLLARDAMKANEVKKATSEKVKKPVPKFQKPGTASNKDDLVNAKHKKAVARLKRTGSTDDAIAALLS